MAFENTRFTPESFERNEYDKVFTESAWNARLLRERGFDNIVDWTQGVDTSVFHPAPRRGVFENRFVIYSGGKLEYRKGQDLVVAAFQQFVRTHPDALLVAAWHNPWIEHALTMNRSPITSPLPVNAENKVDVAQWLANEGLTPYQFVVLDYIPNSMAPAVLRECDVALFPNRAEGGTNLVAMECLACGVPSILAANTGQLDLVADVPCFPLREQAAVPHLAENYHTDGWGESSVDEIVATLHHVYTNRAEARAIGVRAAAAMDRWSWRSKVDLFATEIEACLLRSR
jgi:glycosyltransferase involved in cell wall biosynthesis